MSPHLAAFGISPIERGFLYASGAIKFRPHEEPAKPFGRKSGSKNSVAHGRVREIAIGVVEGRITGENIPQIAAAHHVGSDSLKAAIWRVRQERKAAS